MIHRSLFGFAAAACLIACVTGTTSLGGPRGNQASASSSEDDGGAVDGSPEWSPPAHASMDAGKPGAYACGYSWMPVPGQGTCEYLLPTVPPDHPNDPDLDPATWDPHNVRVDVWLRGEEFDGGFYTKDRAIGAYKETVDACGSAHGWYYLPPSDGGRPTSYALCPTSCAWVTSDDGDFRIAAFGWCGAR